MSGDPRITPVYGLPVPSQAVSFKGPGINCRSTPDLDLGSSNVFATTSAGGIFRNGQKVGPLDYRMAVNKTTPYVINDDGIWVKHYLAGGWRYTIKDLMRFL